MQMTESNKSLRIIQASNIKRITLSERKAQTFRFSLEVLDLVVMLAKKLGTNRVSIFELAVRDLAKREEIKF